MIEHQPAAEGRLVRVELRIGKAPQHLTPRGLSRSKPCVEIAAKHAVPSRGDLLKERARLPPAGGIAEQDFPPRQPVLQVHAGNEQPFAGDGDVRSRDRAELTLTRQRNDAGIFEWLRGQNRVPADGPMLAPQRKEKRKQMTGGCKSAKRLAVAFDLFLQQQDVITRCACRQPSGCEIVHKAHEIAAACVHVPRRDGERRGRRRGARQWLWWQPRALAYAERCSSDQRETDCGVRPRSNA